MREWTVADDRPLPACAAMLTAVLGGRFTVNPWSECVSNCFLLMWLDDGDAERYGSTNCTFSAAF